MISIEKVRKLYKMAKESGAGGFVICMHCRKNRPVCCDNGFNTDPTSGIAFNHKNPQRLFCCDLHGKRNFERAKTDSTPTKLRRNG